MAVACVQTRAGVVQAEVTVTSPTPGWTDQQLLDWKGERHAAGGWAVTWAGNRRSFTAIKTFADSGITKRRDYRRVG